MKLDLKLLRVIPDSLEWRAVEPGRIREPWNPLGNSTPAIALHAVSYGVDRDFEPNGRDSGLFLNFAGMEPTPDEIISFALKNGTLWASNEGSVASEPYAEWEYEVRTMRFVLDVWDAVSAGGRARIITDNFVDDGTGHIRMPYQGPDKFGFDNSLLWYLPYALSGRREETRHGAEHVRPTFLKGPLTAYKGSPREAADALVRHAISARISALGAELSLSNTAGVVCRPRDLIGLLWLQFAAAVAESKEYRKCEICGMSFELDPDINRISRQYCGHPCRVKAFRMRKAEAKRMHGRGKPLKDIAAKLETNVQTIRNWLKPKGK